MISMTMSLYLVPLLVGYASSDVPAFRSLSFGGGNVGTSAAATNSTNQQLALLGSIGAGGCRTNLYPGSYIKNGKDWDTPTPQNMDSFMSLALAANVTPVLLFEYYAPQYLNGSGFGTPTQWTNIGRVFAEYLMPGGVWAKKNGAPLWFGITDYTAFNEPDDGTGFTPGGVLGPSVYARALAGLAAGVAAAASSKNRLHSTSKLPELRTFAGGFMHVNAFGDCTLHGLVPYLSPLWQNGTLAGLDLHTYFDVEYAPMNNTFKHSAQSNFDCVLAAAGIQKPIPNFLFTTTEFNFKKRLISEEEAAKGLFTAIVDQLSVVDANNKPITHRFFPWNLFHQPASDPNYGMAMSISPYLPTHRGCTWAMVVSLFNQAHINWTWRSSDPRNTGVMILEDSSQSAMLVFWQAKEKWTSLPINGNFTLTGVPYGAVSLSVYGWDGLRMKIPVVHSYNVSIMDLPGNETYAFLVEGLQELSLDVPVGCK